MFSKTLASTSRHVRGSRIAELALSGTITWQYVVGFSQPGYRYPERVRLFVVLYRTPDRIYPLTSTKPPLPQTCTSHTVLIRFAPIGGRQARRHVKRPVSCYWFATPSSPRLSFAALLLTAVAHGYFSRCFASLMIIPAEVLQRLPVKGLMWFATNSRCRATMCRYSCSKLVLG